MLYLLSANLVVRYDQTTSLARRCSVKNIFIACIALVSTACDVGQVFGPPTAVVSVNVTSRLQGDTLTVYVNGSLQEPKLTDVLPTNLYRVEAQVRKEYYCSNYCAPSSGTVYVSARSSALGRMSVVKSNTASTDQVISFVFDRLDF